MLTMHKRSNPEVNEIINIHILQLGKKQGAAVV